MDPIDFFKVANQLSGLSEEASWRTSIGRSYYALFNFIKDELKNIGVGVSEGPNGHGEVKIFLSNSGIQEAEKLGSQIGDLHSARRMSDYAMEKVITQKTAILNYSKAIFIKAEFDKLNKGLLATGINNYKAKTNYR